MKRKVLSIGGSKYLDYQNLSSFESVSIAAVFIMSVTAGVMMASAFIVAG